MRRSRLTRTATPSKSWGSSSAAPAPSNDALPRHFSHLAGLHQTDLREDARHERFQILHAVAHTNDDHRADADLPEILLIAQALIRGQDHLKAAVHRRTQQNAVAKTLQTFTADRRRIAPHQMRR